MYTNRQRLKNNAKAIVKTAKPSMLTVAVIFIAVYLVLSTLSSAVLGVNITSDDVQQYMHYYMEGNFDAILRIGQRMTPPSSAYLINALISVVIYILTAGFLIFIFNTVKNVGAVYANLLDGFPLAGKLILLALLQGLFIFLWSLLLIVPGIIAAYRYRMARFLLLDHPDMGVTDCLRASKEMMKGHKWECFVLDLSFLGWYLLAGLPYVGYAVMIWTEPYINTTFVLYYMALAGKPVIVAPAPSEPTFY